MASPLRSSAGRSVERRERAPFSARGEATKVALTTTSWSASAELGVPEWAEQGRRLGTIGRGVGWWIGDWLLYGNERFGERYVRAARITGYDVQTLMNMVYVASSVAPSRRRDRLSFSHHAEVAALDPETQERWLARAEAERLSVRCLREELRRQRRLDSGEEPEPEVEEPPVAAVPGAHADANIVCPACGCRIEGEEAPVAELVVAG